MSTINNGKVGHLVIDGVHDGRCGIQEGAALVVAFHWARTGRKPETAAGGGATLDGQPMRIVSIARSSLSTGFYIATLQRAEHA